MEEYCPKFFDDVGGECYHNICEQFILTFLNIIIWLTFHIFLVSSAEDVLDLDDF